MQSDGGDRVRKVARELTAAIQANANGHRSDVIYHLRCAELLCMPDELIAPPPPPEPLGRLLDITAVSELTGYSKSPTGKVGWWNRPLETALGLPRLS